MAVLPLLIAPEPRLKMVSLPVARVDERIQRLMDDMLETMYHYKGLGLAAPQVDVRERVVVIDITDKKHPEIPPNPPLFLANPEIVWASEERGPYYEGCLSFPDQFSDVTRPKAVRVRYLDRNNQEQEVAGDGLLATCLQHEIDHLNGVLFVDHISLLRRSMIVRRLQKLKRTAAVA